MTTTNSVTQPPDKPWRLTGCICGHLEDSECIRHRPPPMIKVGCGACLALDFQQREQAARLGLFCGPQLCARRLLDQAA